jgi:trehalose/maltose hydrolase-like predicted phosphorylase
MFPWQSGSDGREETQRRHLNPRSNRWNPDNSGLQRHINAAIVYNLWQYYQVTGDLGFLAGFGAELIIEIARFWSSIARYNRAPRRLSGRIDTRSRQQRLHERHGRLGALSRPLISSR